MPPFDYNTAFSGNIGWLTQAEQDRLRPRSVVSSNLSGFFTDVALYMYGLDFLVFEARRVAFTGCTWRHDGDRNPLQQFVLAAGATPTRCHDAPKFIMST